MTKEAEEFVSTWFEDVKYKGGFSNKGADFAIEYDYLDKKLGGEISSISVEMSEQYLSLGKMKALSGLITEMELNGLTEEQKKEIEDEVKRANVMTEYFKKYVNIFEADRGKNFTDELNTTLRIDSNFDGKVDLNENFKRKSDSNLTTQSFFTNLVNDFNEKYSDEEFTKKDFKEDKDIDFMSFADKEEFLEKIQKMKHENKASLDSKEIAKMQEDIENRKNEIAKEMGVNVVGGSRVIRENSQLVLDLLFNNRAFEETSKKVDNEEVRKENELRDNIDKNLGKIFKENSNYQESKNALQSIVNKRV